MACSKSVFLFFFSNCRRWLVWHMLHTRLTTGAQESQAPPPAPGSSRRHCAIILTIVFIEKYCQHVKDCVN